MKSPLAGSLHSPTGLAHHVATRETSPPCTSDLALKSLVESPCLMQASSKDSPRQPEPPMGEEASHPGVRCLVRTLLFLVLEPHKLGGENKDTVKEQICLQATNC